MRTGLAFVFVDAHGEDSIVVAPGANALLDPASVEDAVRRRLAPSGVLVTQAEIPAPMLNAAIRTAAEAAAARSSAWRRTDRWTSRCWRCATPWSSTSPRRVGCSGRRYEEASAAPDAAADLLRLCRSVVVTVGGEGAAVADVDGVQVVAAPQVEVVDSTGAGDAFIGRWRPRSSAGYDLPAAVRIAVRAGAHAVTRPGAQASFASAATLGIAPLRRSSPRVRAPCVVR